MTLPLTICLLPSALMMTLSHGHHVLEPSVIKRLCIVLSVLTLVGCGGKPSTQNDEGQIELANLTPKKRTKSGTA